MRAASERQVAERRSVGPAEAHLNAQLRDLNLVGPGAGGYEYVPCIPDSQTTW
jgi:hypothetical protein